jgi:hypothetical protein
MDNEFPSLTDLVDASVDALPAVTAAANSYGATGEQMAAAAATAWMTCVRLAAPPEVADGIFQTASLVTAMIVMGMTDPESVGLSNPFDGLV